MAHTDFDTPEALSDDLAAFLSLPPMEVRDRLTDRNWRRVALLYGRLLDLVEQGATYFTRALKIRQNPEWAPNRPIRAELKLERINAKVDGTQRELLDALNIEIPEDVRRPRDPLAPRSLAYFIPALEGEADRLEAEARD